MTSGHLTNDISLILLQTLGSFVTLCHISGIKKRLLYTNHALTNLFSFTSSNVRECVCSLIGADTITNHLILGGEAGSQIYALY